MSKGLGKLQKLILFRLSGYKMKGDGEGLLPKGQLYYDIEQYHWGDRIAPEGLKRWDEDLKELKKRRASISQSLRSLKDKGYICDEYWSLGLTEEGQKVNDATGWWPDL